MGGLRSKITMADDLFQNNKYSQAEKIYKEVIDVEPRYADVFYKLGLISHEKENFEEAIDYFQKAVDINPKYYEALMSLSITFNHIGKTDKGRDYYERAINISKDSSKKLDLIQQYKLANEHLKIGNVYGEAGVFDKAIIEYKLALELCPNFHDIREKLGLVYLSIGSFDLAYQEFNYIIERIPEKIQVLNFIGLCFFKMNKLDDAKKLWEKVFTKNPEDKFSRTYLDLLKEKV
jgi:tetratricopeptide (TPR) repeat protein